MTVIATSAAAAPDDPLLSSTTPVSSGRRGEGAGEPTAHSVLPPSTVYSTARTAILQGDVRAALRRLPAAGIDCVVTSPPYWGLRDYGLPAQVWDGSADCDHSWTDGAGTHCSRCGAWRGQLGLEPTPELYIAHMVAAFRDVMRVLKPWGTLWLNIGDCYNAGTNLSRRPSASGVRHWQSAGSMGDRRVNVRGLKPKDLVGMPWRLALALQADGWFLRSDVIWSKPNPVPEGVRDRPVRSHEYVFLFSRSQRYFYDAEAVRVSTVDLAHIKRTRAGALPALSTHAQRSVWSIPTQRYRAAHFATFPERLVEPCISAGTSAAGCCPACGRPWIRKVCIGYSNPGNRSTNGPRSLDHRDESPGFTNRLVRTVAGEVWEPGCTCGRYRVPATVLDPFMGSGTTLAVARRLGRRSIGIELKTEYIELAKERIGKVRIDG